MFFLNIFFRIHFWLKIAKKNRKKILKKKQKFETKKKKLGFEILVRGVIAENFRAIQKNCGLGVDRQTEDRNENKSNPSLFLKKKLLASLVWKEE